MYTALRFLCFVALATAAVACVGHPPDTGPDAEPAPPDAAEWCPVNDDATCTTLHGEMCTADPGQCLDSVAPDVARPFCVTGDAYGEGQNGLGDPDGDGYLVDGFVWFRRCAP